MTRNRTQSTHEMHSFIKALLTASPPESCVERLFSIKKQMHTSTANRRVP